MVSVMRGDGEGKTNNQPSSQEWVSWHKKDKGFSQLAYLLNTKVKFSWKRVDKSTNLKRQVS